MTDIPGHNTDLRPEKAPVWMRRLVDTVHSGRLHTTLTKQQRGHTPADRSRQAAVLVLFAGTETSATLPNDAAVLLTHRSPSLRSHSGQVAFPGGRLDASDTNPVDCALREAWEETGLDRRSVTPLAQLDEVHIRATGYPVYPIVGHWHTRTPVGVVRPEEADEVFDVPVLSLIDPKNRFMVGWGNWTGPAFRINDYVIWGFTGGLLSAALHQAGWEEPWDKKTVHNLQETLAASRNNERTV
ncbi:NUDIX hydrolase [Corynebacterium freiburgense]|uniref:NUDIX hydrolase n=1 Tax=Corynebacterium freiburgense TaxID=556548 RepID=UPI0003FA13DD|nr:CoA pyrophosphatase [Corynebacterium freiburgense]WJZ01473.1 putative NUDIX hydrolase [Corynebacterium freiburgense]